jgi:N-acetylglucosaminyldiphosphoundecaprenol N-acetyl-beta-D-mannosaminyltransferase
MGQEVSSCHTESLAARSVGSSVLARDSLMTVNAAHPLETERGHRKLVVVGGLPFDRVTTDEAATQICEAVVQRQSMLVSTPNLSFVTAAQDSPEFRLSVLSSDLSLADGTPIMWLARKQGTPLPQRVAGADLFDALRYGAGQSILARPLRVFFFGGPEGVAQRASDTLTAEWLEGRGFMQGVGAIYPGHGSIEDMSSDDLIHQINASGADFLVVALGARKGQAWLMHNRHRLTVPVMSHLGAVVNFVAGTVRRAPRFMRKWGMEWLWRIKEEPELFDRYWNDGKGLIRMWFARSHTGL